MNEEITITLIKQFHETNTHLLHAIQETNKHVAEINAVMREHFGIHTKQLEQHDEDIDEIKQDISGLKKRVESSETTLDRIQVRTNMIVKFIYFLWAVLGGLFSYFSSTIKSFFTK